MSLIRLHYPPLAGSLRSLLPAILIALALPGARAEDPVLRVALPQKSLSLSAAELSQLPHIRQTVVDPHEKKSHVYSGVAVRDLLILAGAPLGDQLRGPAMRMAVVVHAKDGYDTLFALAEFDPAFSDRTVLLADSVDGQPLSDNAGPLRLVVPGDQRAARWTRMVTSIEVISIPAKP